MSNRESNYYKDLWETMENLPDTTRAIQYSAIQVIENKDRYIAVQDYFNGEIPWFVIGIIHLMEADGNFRLNLHNGEQYDQETTLVPKGRGPFNSWEESAYDALNIKKDLFPENWDIGNIAAFFERYNGMGYMYNGVNSPYLWSFSNQGVGTGKYIYDGTYDPDAVSKQVGAMVILKEMTNQNEVTIADKEEYSYSPFLYYKCEDKSLARVYQNALNQMMYQLNEKDRLVVDGLPGLKTSSMALYLFGHYLKGDPRNA